MVSESSLLRWEGRLGTAMQYQTPAAQVHYQRQQMIAVSGCDELTALGQSRTVAIPNTKGYPNHGYLDKTLPLLWRSGTNKRAALRHMWPSYASCGSACG